jgi:hypothetical protein
MPGMFCIWSYGILLSVHLILYPRIPSAVHSAKGLHQGPTLHRWIFHQVKFLSLHQR